MSAHQVPLVEFKLAELVAEIRDENERIQYLVEHPWDFLGPPVSSDVRAASWNETERRHLYAADEDTWGA